MTNGEVCELCFHSRLPIRSAIKHIRVIIIIPFTIDTLVIEILVLAAHHLTKLFTIALRQVRPTLTVLVGRIRAT